MLGGEMSDTALEWFRESFRSIQADLCALRVTLEKKSDDLAARATVNATAIEGLRRDLDHGSRRTGDIVSEMSAVSTRVDALENRCLDAVCRDECEQRRKDCAGGKLQAKDRARNWMVAAIALVQLLVAALLAWWKLRGE